MCVVPLCLWCWWVSWRNIGMMWVWFGWVNYTLLTCSFFTDSVFVMSRVRHAPVFAVLVGVMAWYGYDVGVVWVSFSYSSHLFIFHWQCVRDVSCASCPCVCGAGGCHGVIQVWCGCGLGEWGAFFSLVHFSLTVCSWCLMCVMPLCLRCWWVSWRDTGMMWVWFGW